MIQPIEQFNARFQADIKSQQKEDNFRWQKQTTNSTRCNIQAVNFENDGPALIFDQIANLDIKSKYHSIQGTRYVEFQYCGDPMQKIRSTKKLAVVPNSHEINTSYEDKKYLLWQETKTFLTIKFAKL